MGEELIVEHALTPDYDYVMRFDFGLEFILDGLEAILGRDGEPHRVRTR